MNIYTHNLRNTDNIEYPDNLKYIWNITDTHRLNIFSYEHVSDYKNTISMFGDIQNMNDWYKTSNDKINSVSYYSDTSLWICFGYFNEQDLLFIQVNKLNINYGKIKIMTIV